MLKLLNAMKLLILVQSLKYKTMLSYCLQCKKKKKKKENAKSVNPRVTKTNNGKTMILSKCTICDSKKSRFIKKTRSK